MVYKSSLILMFMMCFLNILLAQNLLVEELGWPEEPSIHMEYDLRFESIHDTVKGKPIIDIKYFYPNGQIAIEGRCMKKYKKKGTWCFYYNTGALWSIRTYKDNRLSKIDTLISIKGKSLEHGFGRKIGRKKNVVGHNYVYDSNSEIVSVVRYSNGVIVDHYDNNQFDSIQLNRLVIRQFETSEGDVLEETSIEEAIELQEIDLKPIFLNVTNSWNGYSRNGYKTLFSDPEIASYIKKHYHLAYLDLSDNKKISYTHKLSTHTFEGNPRSGFLKKKLGVSVMSTPTFIFIDSDLKVLSTLVGIKMKKKGFMQQMSYVAEGHYKNQTWKEFFKE